MQEKYGVALPEGGHAQFDSKSGAVVRYAADGSVSGEASLGSVECRLLKFLLDSPGTIRSRDAILKHVWGARVVASGSVAQSIFLVRSALGDGKHHQIIQTLARRGYRFSGELSATEGGPKVVQNTQEDVPAPPAIIDTASLPLERSTSIVGARKLLRVMVLTGLLAALSIAGSFIVHWIWHGLPLDFSADHSGHFKSKSIDVGRVSYRFFAPSPEELVRITEKFSPYLQRQADLPVGKVWVGAAEGYYQVVCVTPKGGARNAALQELDDIDRLLAWCLAK